MRRFTSKRSFVILGSIVLVVVGSLAGYALLGAQAYEDMAGRAQAQAQAVMEARDSVFDDIADSKTASLERKNRVERVVELTEDTPKCEPGGVYDWQANLWYLRANIDQCQKSTQDMAGVRDVVEPLYAFLEQESQLLTLLKPMSTQKKGYKVSEAKFDESLAGVSKVRAGISKMETGKTYGFVQQKAVNQLELIEKEWKSLISANKKQDSKSFLSAVDRLDHAYGGLEVISEESDRQLIKLIGAVRP